MTPDEKSLIEDLFNRLRSATPGGRDTEAERAIEAEMARSPGAAYALVQTVLVQDHALHEAHDKMQAAEEAARQAAARQAAAPQQPAPSFLERAGSALSGFGQRRDAPPPPPQGQPYPPGSSYQSGPYQASEPPQAAPQGGGFMRGALQTAAGVAGGALLFEGVRSMFGGGGGGGLLGGGSAGANSLLGGSGLQGPWGNQAPETVNETIINEAPKDDRNDDSRNDDSRDDNVSDADYDPSDDYSDDTDFDSDDDGSSGSDDSWV